MGKQYEFGYIDDEGEAHTTAIYRDTVNGNSVIQAKVMGLHAPIIAPVASRRELCALRNTIAYLEAAAQLLESEIKAQEDEELRELADHLKIAFINSGDYSKWTEVARAARNHFRDNPIRGDE